MKLAGVFIKNTDRLVKSILDDTVNSITDSYVLFDGDVAVDYPFLNSTFYLVKEFDKSMYGTKKIVNWMSNSPKFPQLLNSMTKNLVIDSVRFQYIKNNQTLQLPDDLKDKAEDAIIQAGLKVVGHNQSNDMWMFLHEETKTAWLGLKVSDYRDFHTEDRKGVLRPQIAYIMNHLVDSKDNRRILDPFAGSGEILNIRQKYFDGIEFLSSDILAPNAKNTALHKRMQADFFALDYTNYFDAIITDPPWGKKQSDLNLNVFYKQMVMKFYSVLKKHGVVVILISKQSSKIMEQYISNRFIIKDRFEFKVWGMPTYLYKLKKY